MEIGDIIDAKDLCNQGTFYLATIIGIKTKYDKDISKDKKCIKHFEMGYISSSRLEQFRNQKGILVHYHEWKDKWHDWIYIDDETKYFVIVLVHVNNLVKNHNIIIELLQEIHNQ